MGFQNGHPAFHKQIGPSPLRPTTRHSAAQEKSGNDASKHAADASRLVGRVACAVFVIGGTTALAQSVGTWKLNLAKSKYTEGQAPKSATLLYEPAGAGIKVTVDMMPAHCPAIHYAYSANYDGKDVPVIGNPNGDMAARTPVDPTTTKLVNKKDGQIVSNMTLVDSADGKTLTITTTGKDGKGQNIDSVAVYEKQSAVPDDRLGARRTQSIRRLSRAIAVEALNPYASLNRSGNSDKPRRGVRAASGRLRSHFRMCWSRNANTSGSQLVTRL